MSQPPLRIGVVGYGYWGPNLVRNFSALDEATVVVVADRSPAQLARAKKACPAVETVADAAALIADPRVEAVAIATPVATHFDLARAALRAGRHVLIEKPIARTVAEAAELVALAAERGLVLMVDHTFVYSGAVRRMRQEIDSGALGELLYYDSTRINLGLLQPDVDVLWDLAVHDLAILHHLVQREPVAVRAFGYRHIGDRHDEVASLDLNYADGFHAHVRTSWLSPVKLRLTQLAGRKKKIVFDDVEPTDKVRIYDKGVELAIDPADDTSLRPIYRAGDVLIPELDRTEALFREARHFVECVRNGATPETGGAEGLAVLRILEAADRSEAAGGAFVPIAP